MGLELFLLIVPEQGSPSESKSSLSFVTANFAPGLSTSPALMLHFGALCIPVPPSSVSPRRGQLEWDPGLWRATTWARCLAASWGLPRSSLHTDELHCPLYGEGLWGFRLLPTSWEHFQGVVAAEKTQGRGWAEEFLNCGQCWRESFGKELFCPTLPRFQIL